MSRSYRGGLGVIAQEAEWADGADIPATPSWTTWARAIDVAFNGSKAEAAVPSRESLWNLRVGGLMDGAITVSYRLRHLADTIWDGLVTKWLADTPLLVACMSTTIATSGAKGWQVPALILEVGESQPLADGASGSVNIVPTDARDASGDLLSPSRLVTP